MTLSNGRIGISGSVLFALNSDQLQPEGRLLLKSLAAPSPPTLATRNEMLMVSGFTDDKPLRDGNHRLRTTGTVGAARPLTVTRVLIDDGVPSSAIFAAASARSSR